jgi:hypothetical protein
MISDLEYSLFGAFYAFRFLSLQDQVRNPDGKLKLQLTPVEVFNWLEFLEEPNVRWNK